MHYTRSIDRIDRYATICTNAHSASLPQHTSPQTRLPRRAHPREPLPPANDLQYDVIAPLPSSAFTDILDSVPRDGKYLSVRLSTVLTPRPERSPLGGPGRRGQLGELEVHELFPPLHAGVRVGRREGTRGNGAGEEGAVDRAAPPEPYLSFAGRRGRCVGRRGEGEQAGGREGENVAQRWRLGLALCFVSFGHN